MALSFKEGDKLNFLFSINIQSFVYTCLFCIFFLLSYFIILSSRLEQLFKQGSTWQIRIAQVLLSLIIAYFLAQGVSSLINNLQI